MKLELFYPLKSPSYVSQGFGENLNEFYEKLGMKGHNGIDIVGNEGQVCRTAHDGIVTFAGEDSSGGLGIVIRTQDKRMGNDGRESYWKTIYWHLKLNSFKVKPGDVVKVGDPIAECDTTGMVTGTHLHFGLKSIIQGEQEWEWMNLEQNNGYFGAVDPAPYWNGIYAEDAQGVLSIYKSILQTLISILENLKQRANN